MASIGSKLYHGGYQRKTVPRWLDALGIEIVGNASFTTPDPARPGTRKIAVPLVEGLAALVSGDVLASYVALDGVIFVKIAPHAYAGALTTASASVTGAVVGYYDRAGLRVGSSLPSSSGRGSKTEISLAVTALVEALLVWRKDKRPEAGALLGALLELLRALDSVGALPLPRSTASIPAAAAAGILERVRDLGDRIYAWCAYEGRKPGSVGAADWTFGDIRTWPVTGDAADDVASFAGGDIHEALANPAQLERELGAASPAPATAGAPATGPTKGSRPVPAETWLQRCVRYAAAVGVPILLSGPASTGKTTAFLSVQDGLPLVRTSMTAESDVAIAVGDLARDAAGQWVPRLGRLSHVVRYAMLAAVVTALRLGGKLTHSDAAPFGGSDAGREVWWALEALAADPDDRGSRELLDSRAWPYDPDSWDPVAHAWRVTGAHAVGPTVRLFLDELHDAASANAGFGTLLKLALEDERLYLTELGGAGWRNMYCHNVAFAGGGNPDERGDFGRALRSRFGYTIGVGYPTADELLAWQQRRFAAGAPGATVRVPDAKPVSIVDTLVPARARVPPVALSEKEMKAAVALSTWTFDQRQRGTLAEGLEPRGVGQLLAAAQHLRTHEAMDPASSFREAALLVVDRLCEHDDMGLPAGRQRDPLLQKVAQLAGDL